MSDTDAPTPADAPSRHGQPSAAPGPVDDPAAHPGSYRSVHVLRAWLPFAAVALLISFIAGVTWTGFLFTEGATSANFHHVFYLFDVGREYNIPTWYSSMLWALLGLLALFIGSQARRFRLSWILLGIVGMAASIDEYQELHERLDGIGFALRGYLPFYVPFPWLVVGVPLALVVGALLLPLVLSLPRRTTLGIIAAGATFLSGAVGMELLSGYVLASQEWVVDSRYVLVTLIEETLEMLAIGLAVASLLSLFERDADTGTWRVVRLSPRATRRRAPEVVPAKA
ncbi:hypothetical protein [Brachybacterium epidermidis]|uniref:hypothetical protein n=1 Tax=Brachybacterium epidermidis TaxID=2781983 RepID=UPI00398EA2D5